MTKQPPYGDWLNYPTRPGFVASLGAVLPDWDQGDEDIFYLTQKDRAAMTLDFIGAGLLKPDGAND